MLVDRKRDRLAYAMKDFFETEEAFFPGRLNALKDGVLGMGVGLQLAYSGWE